LKQGIFTDNFFFSLFFLHENVLIQCGSPAAKYHTAACSLPTLLQGEEGENRKSKSEKTHGQR